MERGWRDRRNSALQRVKFNASRAEIRAQRAALMDGTFVPEPEAPAEAQAAPAEPVAPVAAETAPEAAPEAPVEVVEAEAPAVAAESAKPAKPGRKPKAQRMTEDGALIEE